MARHTTVGAKRPQVLILSVLQLFPDMEKPMYRAFVQHKPLRRTFRLLVLLILVSLGVVHSNGSAVLQAPAAVNAWWAVHYAS